MGKLIMKVEGFAPLPDEVYKQVKYEVVMKDNALTENELDEVLERIYKAGRFNSTFIRDIIIDVCGGIDEIENFDAYILGRLVGYLRAIFLMHKINGNAIEKPAVKIEDLIMYGAGKDLVINDMDTYKKWLRTKEFEKLSMTTTLTVMGVEKFIDRLAETETIEMIKYIGFENADFSSAMNFIVDYCDVTEEIYEAIVIELAKRYPEEYANWVGE